MTAAQVVPPLASLWLRLGVRLLLATLGWLSTVGLALLVGTTFGIVEAFLLVLVGFVVRAAFAALLVRPGRYNGQSLSKQVAGMRVVDERGVPITYGKALAREAAWPLLIGLLSIALIGVLLAFADGISALVDDQRRRLVDRILGTRVVVSEPVPYWIPDATGAAPAAAWWPGASATQTPGIAFAAPAAPVMPDGWYADPSNPALLRYWAAGSWTDHTHQS